MLDYVHLRMAEGLLAFLEEEHEKAIHHFEAVLGLESEVKDKELIAIANFWIGRCYRHQGRYDDALSYVAKARVIAAELQFPKMSAVMQILEGWILFQEGKLNAAAGILGEAESVLLGTDDYVSRGNINSAYGRMARRKGKYDQALKCFANAIEEYKERDAHDRNLARSLVNIAFVKRLLALQLRNRIDNEMARIRKNAHTGSACASANKLRDGEHLERLRGEARGHLAEAKQIYARYDDHRGPGNVHVTYGYLYLDNGELDRAAAEGASAYRLGDEKKDHVLKARARVLQSAIECAMYEEQIEEGSGHGQSSQLACEFAREAVECAKDTQNRRLIAKTLIALGLALCLDLSNDVEAARQSCDQATALLNPDSHDYVWRESHVLKSKLQQAGSIDSVLRGWSNGLVGDKTFQQISEEFAAILIPKVWRREGRKVSRVAKKLSISPKKVRRILRNQGLFDRKRKRTVDTPSSRRR